MLSEATSVKSSAREKAERHPGFSNIFVFSNIKNAAGRTHLTSDAVSGSGQKKKKKKEKKKKSESCSLLFQARLG